MSQGEFDVGPPNGTPSSLDYDPHLLNAALTESITQRDVSSQRRFTGTPNCDVESTEGREIGRFPGDSNPFHRDAGAVTSINPATTDVTQQCLSLHNPFAVDVKQQAQGSDSAISGNPPISDPSNPFFDAVHSQETNGEAMDVDDTVETGTL